jgi:hypothetical protein
VLGLGGIQLLSLSSLGAYLGPVLEETKGRPRFIRARIFSSRGELSNEVEIGRYLAELRHERSNRQC